MAFSIGLATVKYKEGLAVVGVEGGTAFVPSSGSHIDPLSRDLRAEPGRIVVTCTQEGIFRIGHLV